MTKTYYIIMFILIFGGYLLAALIMPKPIQTQCEGNNESIKLVCRCRRQ